MPRKPREEGEHRIARGIRERLRDRYLKGPQAISQRRFADRLGVSFATVNAWFRNPPAMPDAATLYKIAWLDGWNLNYLLLGEGPELRRSIPVGHHLDEKALLEDYAKREVERYVLWRLRRGEEGLRSVQADIASGRLTLTRFKPPRKRSARR